MSNLTKRMLRLLWAAKGQNIAIALVIGIGLMFYIAMSSAIENLDATVNAYDQATNSADLYVALPRATVSDVNRLKGVAGVAFAQGRVVKDVRYIGAPDEKVSLRVISIPQTERPIHDLYHHDLGKTLTTDGEAFLIESFSKARGIAAGQKIKIQSLGQDDTLTVKGIVSSSEYVYLMENEQAMLPDFKHFGVLYVTENYALSALGTGGAYNQILIKIKAGYQEETVLKAVEKHLKNKGVSKIYLKKDQLSHRMVQEEISGNRKSGTAVPLFFLSVAAVILYVMVSRLVKNDRMSIGILKALGFDNRRIIQHYCLYTLVIGLVGAGIGISLGTLLAYYITVLYATESFNLPVLVTKFQMGMFVRAILLSGGFSLVAGVVGAYETVRIDPSVAMRPQAPKTGKRIWLEGTRLWKALSFTEKMVMRNLLRHKWRMVMLGIGVALTYMVVMMPSFFMDAFVDMFEFQYGQMQVMDYNIGFSKPLEAGVVGAFKELEAVRQVEGRLESVFELRNGHYKKAISVIGLRQKTQMFRFYEAGTKRRVWLEPNSVFMSEGLAKTLHIKRGDWVSVKSYLPNKDEKRYQVTAIIQQSLGANVYMPVDRLQKDFFEKGLINGVYVKGRDDLKRTLVTSKEIEVVQSVSDMKNTYKAFMEMTNTSIGMMLVFGIILGVAIVYNAVMMMMGERAVEIASMRVLGMYKGEIFSIFIREILAMSLMGVLLGMPLGKMALKGISSVYMTELYAFNGEVLLKHYVSALVYTLLAVGISLLLSYRKISRADFMEALKNRVT